MPHDRKPADVVEVRSMFALAETIDRLDSEITTRGLRVFARIDHAANDPVALAAAFGVPPSDAAPLQALPAIVQAAAREQHADREA